MNKTTGVVMTAAIGVAALSLTAPANAGGSDVGPGLLGFGIGAVVGSALTPQTVYVAPPPVYYAPPPPVYYAPPPVYVGPVFYGRAPHHHHRHRR